MKKVFWSLLFLFAIFIGLVYGSLSVGPENPKLSEVLEPDPASIETFRSVDTVLVRASNLYEANPLKRFMQGTNYRQAWAAPVEAPVVYLDSMTVLKKGGGTQTQSLRLQGTGGRVYSLRSINKNPQALVPEIANTLGLQNIVKDGISAQHPYGALLAAALSEKAGILHTHPRLVFVPEQPALGTFNTRFGNRLYLLEFETEGKTNWTPFDSVYGILETDQFQELKLAHGERVKIDRSALVRARLFDILIGDWDRHAKQWGWVVQQRKNQFIGIPLPGDRDNAFFRIDGVLPTILTNELVQPLVRPFEQDVDHLPGFVYPMDVYFLKDAPKDLFPAEARYLQRQLSDSVLEQAFEVWPESLSRLNKEELLQKLISRRDKLTEYAEAFYLELQKRKLLSAPLKGSEDLALPEHLIQCFGCPESRDL